MNSNSMMGGEDQEEDEEEWGRPCKVTECGTSKWKN
jgi:hypothetical protein